MTEHMQAPAGRVAVFVDYRNLWHNLQSYFASPPSPQEVLKAILEAAKSYGSVVVAKAYADWTSDRTGANAAQAEGFDPNLVLRKHSGADRSDATMMLDAYDMTQRQDVTVCVLVTGDADFRAVIRRLKERGKQVVVCAIAQSASRDLISEANPFVTVESLLDLRPATPDEQELRQLTPFIRTMLSLEGKLPFVGLTYLRDTVLRPGLLTDDSKQGRHNFVNDLITRGILETHLAENPRRPEFPTTAVKLNREHALVQGALELLPSPN